MHEFKYYDACKPTKLSDKSPQLSTKARDPYFCRQVEEVCFHFLKPAKSLVVKDMRHFLNFFLNDDISKLVLSNSRKLEVDDGVFLDQRPSPLLPIRPTSTWF